MRTLRRKPLGSTLLAIGVLAILVSLLADEIGLGDQPGFNWKQALLLAAGVALALLAIAIVTGVGARAVEEATDPAPRDSRGDPPMPPPE